MFTNEYLINGLVVVQANNFRQAAERALEAVCSNLTINYFSNEITNESCIVILTDDSKIFVEDLGPIIKE